MNTQMRYECMNLTVQSNTCILFAQGIYTGARVCAKIGFLQIFYGQIHLPSVTVYQCLGNDEFVSIMQLYATWLEKESERESISFASKAWLNSPQGVTVKLTIITVPSV